VVNVDFSLVDAETGEALPSEADVIDQGKVMFVVGAGGYIKGLHSSVQKLGAVGVEQTFTLPPAECFGDSNPDLGPVFVPKEAAPEGLKVGDRVKLANGLKATIVAADASGVTIDANKPLSGKSLKLKLSLSSEPKMAGESLKMATVAAGCFWGMELAFQRQPGVLATEVGYAQGEVDEPDYKTVCSGSTGHTEAVRVLYDPAVVSYEELLALFWARLGESRYKLNQVGNDRGTQYRHGIYPHDGEQLEAAKASLELAKSAADGQTIHTEIEPAKAFWRAEEYHQQYLQKGGQSAKKQAAEYYALAESEGFFSHFAAYNEQILRPLKNAGEFTTEGAKQEIIATLMLQPRDLRNGFVLYNVLAFLFGVAEAFTSMALGHGPWSLIWNGGAGYCIAYTLYWIFLCKQAKVCVQVASRRVRTHPARSLCRPPA
jgi:peptide-methionine (S)-S-oxide reductase